MNSITDAATGRYIDVNDNFAGFCGFSKEDIIGKNSLELDLIVDPESREEMIRTLKQNGFARDVLTEVKPQTWRKTLGIYFSACRQYQRQGMLSNCYDRCIKQKERGGRVKNDPTNFFPTFLN